MTINTSTDIRSAAELERQRLAEQAAQARAGARTQAQQAQVEIESQTQQAISETERQAQTAKTEVEQEAETRQATIRKQRGQAEREAEAAKAQARQAQRLEQRKVVLPISKPRDLGLTSYIANVEATRKQAHQAGASAKAAVTKVRDDYFEQVDKAKDDAIADINRQKAGIVKDIQEQLVNINADITKQLANLNSGVDEWEADSKDKIAKAQADYQAAIQAALNRSGTEVFADMKSKGLIPANAAYDSYDKATGQLNYMVSDTRSGQEIFTELQSQNKIAPNTEYESYDSSIGEINYQLQTPNFGINIFKRMQNAGTIPKDATFVKYDGKDRTVTYFVTSVGITTIPEKTGLSPTPDNSVTTSTLSSTVESSQNSANVVDIAASTAAMAGFAIMFEAGTSIVAIPTPPTWLIGGLVIIAAGIATYFTAKKIQSDLQRQGITEQQAADAVITNKDGTVAYSIQQYTALPQTKEGSIEYMPVAKEEAGLEQLVPPKIEPYREQIRVEQQQLQPESLPALKEPPIAITRDPMDIPELRQKASNVLVAAAGVQAAAKEIQIATKTIPMTREQWNLVEKALQQGKMAEGKRIIESLAKKATTPEIGRHLSAAYQEYLRKKAILDAARKSYVASLNPQPIKGKASTDATAAAIGIWLAQDIIRGKVAKALKEGKSLSQAIAEAQADIKEAAQQLGLTQQQINAATATIVYQVALFDMAQAAVQAASQAQAQNLTATQIQTQTLEATKAAAQAAVQSAVQTQTLTLTQAAELAQELDQVAEAVATTTAKIKLPKLPAGASSTDKQRYPDGTIVWCMGETKRGEEYKIIPPPYTMRKPISSRYPPKGMAKTKGTPQETLTFIGGKLPFKNVSFDLGVTDGFIDVKSRTIKFTGSGQQTNVGTRIESTTKGVALTHNPPLIEQLTRRPTARHLGSRGGNRIKLDIGVKTTSPKKKSRLISHGVYSDRKGTRITRKRHRGWKRIY